MYQRPTGVFYVTFATITAKQLIYMNMSENYLLHQYICNTIQTYLLELISTYVQKKTEALDHM